MARVKYLLPTSCTPSPRESCTPPSSSSGLASSYPPPAGTPPSSGLASFSPTLNSSSDFFAPTGAREEVILSMQERAQERAHIEYLGEH